MPAFSATDSWIFCLHLLPMQRTTEIPKTPWRKASPCCHGQISIHGSLSWGKCLRKPAFTKKYSLGGRDQKCLYSYQIASFENKRVLKISTTCLQNILMKHFNFIRSTYFPSAIFQNKIWNFLSNRPKCKRQKQREKKEGQQRGRKIPNTYF